MFARNMEAFKAFQQRKIDGFTVSDRVWKAVEGAKENLEFYLSSGISTGRPAASIAVDIRQLLQNPERRFRRVRNEEGKLVLSKPMQDYHPGQGVYRSSYMNALRIAATETNMSYHSADHERWKNQGFVLGIEVSRSKSNKGPCYICDPMVGRYPKDYKFIGNHPWCICVAVPVMLEGEEYIDYLLTGKVPGEKIIRTVPQSAIDFVNEKASHRDNLFVKQNSKFFAGKANTTSKVSTNTDTLQYKTLKSFKNGGNYAEYNSLDRSKSDYNMVKSIGIEFARIGKQATATPIVHFKSPEYGKIYGALKDTKYWRKCPDLLIDGQFYEVESFIPPFKKRKMSDMIKNGTKQSSRIIINNTKGCSDRFILDSINRRLHDKNFMREIKDVWVYEKGKIRQLYPKKKG
jgi:hypothetical protein